MTPRETVTFLLGVILGIALAIGVITKAGETGGDKPTIIRHSVP